LYGKIISSKRGRNIRVQPTSVARRRGSYKGNHSWIGAGRPPTEKSTAGRNSLLNKNKKKWLNVNIT